MAGRQLFKTQLLTVELFRGRQGSHRRPFVRAFQVRSGSHLFVLGAILWAFIPKLDKLSSKLTFEIPPRRALRGPSIRSPPLVAQWARYPCTGAAGKYGVLSEWNDVACDYIFIDKRFFLTPPPAARLGSVLTKLPGTSADNVRHTYRCSGALGIRGGARLFTIEGERCVADN